jgi:hypothetical protein
MPRLLLPLVALAALAPLVSAGVKFTNPAPGDKLKAGTAITVEWEEGGTGPKLTDLSTFQLFLCAGGDGVAPVCGGCWGACGRAWTESIAAQAKRLDTD